MVVHTYTDIPTREISCPYCKNLGAIRGDVWLCSHCENQYQYRVICDVCNNGTKRLRACSGIEEYYCDTCRSPKSKSKVIFELTKTA